jgi:tetratricopeptide (TPR) repeat protein
VQFGPYEVIRELGRGGMGIVYLVRHAALGREFALKTLRSGEMGSEGEEAHPELIARFVREARAAARLAADPGTVAVHDVGAQDGIPYLAMDYVPGGDLREIIEAADYDPRDGLRIMEMVCRSVHRAHQAGVLHRDLKPENVLMGAEANPRVTDYGLAKLQELDADSRALTRTGALLGTVGYMAPEQLAGKGADVRSDVHALGVILFEVMTGVAPYEGDSAATVLNHVMRMPPRSPRMPGLDVSRDLEAVILKALEKDPRKRFQTAEELADEIARVRAGRETRTRPAGLGGKLVRIAADYPGLVLLLLVGALMGGGAVWFSSRTQGTNAGKAEELEQRRADAAEVEAKRVAGASYLSLLQAVRDDLLQLEDAFHGNRTAQARAAATVRSVQAKAKQFREQFTGAPAPIAVALLAKHYGGDIEASNLLATLAGQFPRDPFPQLIHAQARWASYSEHVQVPGIRMGVGGVATQPFRETAVALKMRNLVTQALQESESMAELPVELAPWRRWGDAARLLAEGKHADAERAFGELGDEPLLAHGALMLQGVAVMLQGRDAEAAPILERAGARGWVKALKLAGAARLSEALGKGPGARGPVEALERARRNYGAALEMQPDDLEARMNLAVVQIAGIVSGLETPADAGGRFKDGVQALTAVVKEQPDRIDARRLRGGVMLFLARQSQDLGRDPRTAYRAALADLEVVASAGLDGWTSYGLGLVHYELARADAMQGVDPSPGYASALRALEAGVQDPVVRSNVLGIRALVRLAQAEMAATMKRDHSELLQQAEQDFSRSIALAPNAASPLRLRASRATQMAQLVETKGGDPAPVYERAVDDLTKALAMLPANAQIRLDRGSNRMVLGDTLSDAAKPGATAHYEGAVEDYRAAIELQPKNWQSLANLGMALGRLGRWNEAVAPLQEAVKLAPGHPQLREILQDARARAGR